MVFENPAGHGTHRPAPVEWKWRWKFLKDWRPVWSCERHAGGLSWARRLALFQGTAASILTSRSPSILTTRVPRRPPRFAGTFRDDGIEDVADTALGAVVTHVQTLSAPYVVPYVIQRNVNGR
jgi:hypothetical protein